METPTRYRTRVHYQRPREENRDGDPLKGLLYLFPPAVQRLMWEQARTNREIMEAMAEATGQEVHQAQRLINGQVRIPFPGEIVDPSKRGGTMALMDSAPGLPTVIAVGTEEDHPEELAEAIGDKRHYNEYAQDYREYRRSTKKSAEERYRDWLAYSLRQQKGLKTYGYGDAVLRSR